MRKTVLILVIVAAAIILASCERTGSDNPVTIYLDGSTKMRIAMRVNPDLGIHTGDVTISKGDLVYSQPLEFDDGHASVLFSDLQPGIWLVEVELRDEDDYVLYQGSGEAGVVGGQTNSATIVVEELSGDLEVIVELPTDWSSIEPSNFSLDAITINFDDLPEGPLTDELAHLGAVFVNTKVISRDHAPSTPNQIEPVEIDSPMRAIFVDPTTLEPTVTTRVGMYIDLDGNHPPVAVVAYDFDGAHIGTVPFSDPGDFAGIEYLDGIASVEFGPQDGYDDFLFEPVASGSLIQHDISSDSTWEVYDADPASGPAILVGNAQSVCIAPTVPSSCLPGAVVYCSSYSPSAWQANLSSIPGASWVWAPGISGTSSPAEDSEYFFSKEIDLGVPVSGILLVAVDDFAEVLVNGTSVGTMGSTSDPGEAFQANQNLLAFEIVPFLVPGPNIITVRVVNGPAWFSGDCETDCTYCEHPAGVVFGGTIVGDGSVPFDSGSFRSEKSWYR